jgi:hypothetical protein
MFVLLALLLVSAAPVPGPTPKSPDALADDYAQAILRSHDGTEVDRRLHEIKSDLADRSLVLPVLFSRVARSGASDSHWAALCRIDAWGDGAWHLEMKGSAFDGLAANPEAFSRRYIGGDDCGLLLLLYAYAWTLEAPDVGGIDCSVTGQAEAERFVQVMRQSVGAITKLGPVKAESTRIRLNILVGVASAIDVTLVPTLRRFHESCAKEAQ